MISCQAIVWTHTVVLLQSRNPKRKSSGADQACASQCAPDVAVGLIGNLLGPNQKSDTAPVESLRLTADPVL